MATSPAVPKFDTPALDDSGRFNVEWWKALSRQGHSGAVSLTATAGAGTLPATPAGFITIFVNGDPKLLPYYNP